MVQLEIDSRDDLELLAMERRSVARHPAFVLRDRGARGRLIPDGMFAYRQRKRGMMVCFVEMDTGQMNRRQVEAKWRRYETWSQSARGRQFLLDFYRSHGAQEPRPVFRILVITKSRTRSGDTKRAQELVQSSKICGERLQRNLSVMTVEDLAAAGDRSPCFVAI